VKCFRILFLGTPDIAVPCLEKLASLPEIEIVGVVTQPDRPAGRHMKLQPSPVKTAALQLGLPVVSPETVKSPEFGSWANEQRAESSVVVAFGQILPKDFLALFSKGSVNVHASLLPRWRGAAPIQRSLMEGDRETGVSLQVIVPKLDAGPLLGARSFVIDDDFTANDLYMKMKIDAASLLENEYLRYLKGELSAVAQDEKFVTIAQKISKEEGLIDWSKEAHIIRNRIRGLWMWPGSWTVRGGKTLKIWVTKVNAKISGKPGQIKSVSANSVTVACGSGGLEIFEVQPESRARMPVAEYLKGYPLNVGDLLGQ
jgi:methionyl-tRNA formyltransferase